MPIDLNVTLDVTQVHCHLDLTEKELRLATRRAINKTARWVRAQVSREVAADLSIRVGLIRERLVILLAHRSRDNAQVGMKTQHGAVSVSKTGRATQNPKGVRIARRQFDRAFLATMPSGHEGVFRRRGKARLPIKEVQLVLTGKIQTAFERLEQGPALNRLARLFEQERRFIRR